MVLGPEVEETMEDIRRNWFGIEKEKPEGHLLSLMGSHDIWSRTTPDPAVFTGRLLFVLLVLSTQASIWDPWLSRPELLLRPLQVILKTESLSFNKISSLLITTTFVCPESWTGGESSLQAVKCNDECGIKIWTDWNKEEVSWYSEKYNTSVLNTLKFILAKVRPSLEPTY